MSSFVQPKREMHSADDQVAVVGDHQVIANQKDDEKMPLFLIKLWNIVEDPAYCEIVRWDESGYSFHILDPYSFCRNVLPNYFKHNNLNSLIRQLNMYGFRKMTPLDRTGLTRAESDQDHLEFSHPYFVREHPELLVNIKRKASNRAENTGSQSNFSSVTEELRVLRDKQRNMDAKMSQLVKENEQMWEQISVMRGQHMKQQQVVQKLVQFLVALVQPQQKGRIPKRGMLALDEPPLKRSRSSQSNTLSDVLDNLQRQLSEGNGPFKGAHNGPIIADITDDLSPNLAPSPQGNYSYGQANHKTMADASMERPHAEHEDIAGPSRLDHWHPGNASPGALSSINPTLSMSPSFDRMFPDQFQEYLMDNNQSIDNCRDSLGNLIPQNLSMNPLQWDADLGDMSMLEGWNDDGDMVKGSRLALEAAGDHLNGFPGTPDYANSSPSVSPPRNSQISPR